MNYSIKDGKAVIPNNVTEIDNYAFRGCTGLTSIEIPNSVTGRWTFSGCTSLKHFRIHMENPDDATGYFEYSGLSFSDITLFVPVGTGYAYRHHEFFKNFKEIIATSK